MVRNNKSNIKTRASSRKSVSGRGTSHSDMKMMDVSPPTTDGKTTGRRRPLHEGAGTVGEQDASSDIMTTDAELVLLAPPSPTVTVGLSAKAVSAKNNSDDYQRTRKRHHTSSTTTTRNQKTATASATAATVARAALRNSSVHSSNSSSGSGGDNGNTSNTTTGASVKFAMPPKVVAGGSATGSSLSLSSDADSNSKKVSALKQQQQHAAGASEKIDGTSKSPPSSHTLGSNNDSSRSKSSSGSGSGSDGNEGGATSSSNPAVVTQSTYNPNATSSGSGGGDARSTSGSGSGSDGGMGGNNRRNGEETTVSNEYYFAGYGSGSLAGRASTSGNSGGPTEDAATSPQAPQANANANAAAMPVSGEMPSFASFRGATLTASANAAAAGMHPQGNNESNLSSRHVAVATDGAGGLPPPPPPQQQAQESRLRHHLRYHHHHRHDLQAPPLPHGGVAASRPVLPPAGALEGIPSAIGGPPRSLPQPHQHYELRLPPSDEQAVLQRVPRAHATVVAHDLPPPPTSSDAWSSTSGSRSSSKHRKLTVASASASATTVGQPFSVASAGMADGKTMGTVNETSRTSPTSSVAGENIAKPQAMHVSTDDPILRKKMSLKDDANPAMNKALCPNLKRKAGSLAREASDDSSDGVKSESEERSGSEEGYEGASSSNDNRPSSGSGSDSVSSDDAKKVATARNPPSNPSEVRMGSQSNSKRTETSSMSSSVLADFSSVVNEETRVMNSGSSSPRSESSSLTSTGNEAQAKTMLTPTVGAVNLSEKPTATQASSASIGSKRNAFHLKSPAEGNKRSKPFSPASIELPSAANNTMNSGLAIIEKTLQSKVRSAHHHHYHNRRNVGRKLLQQSYLSAQRDLSDGPSGVQLKDAAMTDAVNTSLFEEATIYSLGHDAMANIASFLEPQETHSFLTTPFSKTWLETYTAPQELWKILCTSKPFFAMLPNSSESGDDASTSSYPLCNDLQMKHLFGRYRLLYSSFVRCMKYLNRLQDDALNGREPSITMKSNPNDMYPFNNNVSLKAYFAKARRIVRSRRGGTGSESGSQESLTSDSTNEKKRKRQSSGGSGPRLGNSMITNRLLRPTATGEVDNVNLPWSCAIYSVVNWMVAFQDVEGIQIMCLKCLPYLLEDEQQRTTAQRAGLTDNVLRAMVLFPDSIELHTVAFHTLVLLARPLGGNEGMLFHTAMVNTRGIFNNGSSSSKNGIVIMLDSMRRFAQDEILQAMSCWSLVNVALTPLQKSMLVKLGGLTVTANAMLQHPYNVEVQFRALFALINLVIPSK